MKLIDLKFALINENEFFHSSHILTIIVKVSMASVLTTKMMKVFPTRLQMTSKAGLTIKKSAEFLIAGLVATSLPAWGAPSPFPPKAVKFQSIELPNFVKFDLTEADPDANLLFTCGNGIGNPSTAFLTTITPFGEARTGDVTTYVQICETSGVKVIANNPSSGKQLTLFDVPIPGKFQITADSNGAWDVKRL